MVTELADLTADMKAAIGQSGPTTTYEVTTLGIRTFARAVGYRNPIYFNEDEAKKKGHRALVAPPGYLGMPVFDPNRQEGGRRADFESPFKRNLNGGTEVEPLETVYAGDVLESVTTLAKLELTKGRLGQMLIRTSETVYTRQSDDKVVAKTRGTGISY
ncbi:MAG: MaoC family dehydratase [Chloroflexi bacterium]|nr:MaoC family dehydratase [Chloroflexota bacterium]